MNKEKIKKIIKKNGYKYGFDTPLKYEDFPKGLNEDIIRKISSIKKEPDFILRWRLKAYRNWIKLNPPNWANIKNLNFDYQSISYYSSPKNKKKIKSLKDVDPEILKTYERLGIPLTEQKRLSGVAIDAIFDSVSVGTVYKENLRKYGIIFCPISEAIRKYPDIVKKYLGKIVPINDNFFSDLNSAVFSDGSFCYIPKNVRCPMELSTYFRINKASSGQFERTLVIAEEGSYVSYLEGCTAPMRDENQLHAAVVELFAHKNSEIKYSTVQNWYPGDEKGRGGIYNLVTKRGLCYGDNSKISWTQVETGSAITWKYPSVILKGNNSKGKFYSVALTNNYQQADTGTKMIHIGKKSRSMIISKSIALGHSQNNYRGLVKVIPRARNSRNYTQCDALLIGNNCRSNTFPYIEVKNKYTKVEHEASASKIDNDKIIFCKNRGLSEEDAVSIIVNGFCKEIIDNLPMEFALEAKNLLNLKLEDNIG